MPLYTLNISATSPVIKYSGDWVFQEGAATSGSAPDSDTINFTFNGTSLAILGEHLGGLFPCSYEANIDGDHTSLSVQQDSIFFSQKNLPHIPHNVSIFHLDDLGCPDTVLTGLTLSLGDGNTETKSTEATLSLDSSNVTYSGTWGTGIGNHSTSKTTKGDASARLSFYGNGISMYGSIGKKFGVYDVNLDGVPQVQRNATSAVEAESELLFFAHNLTSGPHDLVLTNIPLDRSSLLGLNHAVVTIYDIPIVVPTSSSGTSSSGTKSADPSSSTASSTATPTPRESNTAAIAGGVFGGLVALGLLGFLFFTLTRRHFRRRYAPPRFSTVIEEGETPTYTIGPAASSAQRQMAEVDMPPPDYRGVFPSEFGSTDDTPTPRAVSPPNDVQTDHSSAPTPVSSKRAVIGQRQASGEIAPIDPNHARKTRVSHS